MRASASCLICIPIYKLSGHINNISKNSTQRETIIMWDQKSGKSNTIIDGPDQKSHFESSQQDSGFLSGPQNIFSSSEIYDDDITDKPSIGGGGNCTNIAPKSSNLVTSSYTDSGAIEDFVDEEDDQELSNSAKDIRSKTQITSQSNNMILDSGVDLGLEEWFCGLNLKNSTQPLNNLGSSCRKAMLDAQRFPKFSKKLQQTPLWEICYIQDDDGDT